jgi:hypothetical protein
VAVAELAARPERQERVDRKVIQASRARPEPQALEPLARPAMTVLLARQALRDRAGRLALELLARLGRVAPAGRKATLEVTGP